MSRRWFVTGALGCIGAHVVKALIDAGDEPWLFDRGEDRQRLDALMDPEFVRTLRFVNGDLTDRVAVERALLESQAEFVIHLAGLQVPTCRADPVAGAMVNVVGTLNVFEAARVAGVRRVVYASSAAVYGEDDRGEEGGAPDESVDGRPATHYGVFKRANEGNAAVYYRDHGISSVGLRPLTVYGVGRDFGLTSDPTRAMKAAVAGRAFTIRFTGSTDFVYVEDCARVFLACAERAPKGAFVFNVHGHTESLERIVEWILEAEPTMAGRLRMEGGPIPFPSSLDGSALERAVGAVPRTPLIEGVRQTLRRFRELSDAGRLSLHDLD